MMRFCFFDNDFIIAILPCDEVNAYDLMLITRVLAIWSPKRVFCFV